MSEVIQLVQSLGLPAGVGAAIILVALVLDWVLKRYTETKKVEGDESRAERVQLSSDQAAFRKSLFDQIATLQEQLQDAQKALEAAVARHLDAERRVVEFQLTIARLAAALISSGVAVPPSTIADLSLSPPPSRWEAGKAA